jgi:hypothetical protein
LSGYFWGVFEKAAESEKTRLLQFFVAYIDVYEANKDLTDFGIRRHKSRQRVGPSVKVEVHFNGVV